MVSAGASIARQRFPVPENAPVTAPGIRDDVEQDDAEMRLQTLRKRGSGINLRTSRPTTARMARILRLMGLTMGAHSQWCGFPPKTWLALNPSWTEQEWARLVAENHEQIRSAA